VARSEGLAIVNIEPEPQRSIFIKKSNSKTLDPQPQVARPLGPSVPGAVGAKIVTFDNILIIYYFKDYEDRKGYWIENRCHFQRHCNRIQDIISFIFQDAHRDKIQKLIHKWTEDSILASKGGVNPTTSFL
jgi:DNA-binding cell septation regulator SpoVG